MDEEAQMFYTVYKITNQVNGKIYVGVHKTPDLNDDYMGSGKRIKYAKEKYGIENFTREYLQVFDNAEDMFKMESELVNEEFIARDDTYNLKAGGQGGWSYINSSELSPRASSDFQRECGRRGHESMMKRRAEDSEYNDMIISKCRASVRLAGAMRQRKYPMGTFLGKSHSDETKTRMSEKAKLRTGEKNSQFGMMWIMNSESGESKKIKKDEPIPGGWVKGRKQNRK